MTAICPFRELASDLREDRRLSSGERSQEGLFPFGPSRFGVSRNVTALRTRSPVLGRIRVA